MCLMSSWHPCRAFFWYLLGITSHRAFWSSLNGVTNLYRTPSCSTKWLCCLRYCFIICGSHEYTLHPFSLFLLIRYIIFTLLQGPYFGLQSNFLLTSLLDPSLYLRSQWPVYCRSRSLSRWCPAPPVKLGMDQVSLSMLNMLPPQNVE